MTEANGHVVVTGAASGIGAATVTEFLKKGYQVHAIDVNMTQLETAAKDWEGQYWLYGCDVTEEASVDSVIDSVATRTSTLHGVVNAAGIREIQHPFDLSIHDWNDVLAVNLSGTFLVCKSANRLLQDGSSIVNISSSAGLFGITHRAAYSASKHGVIGLSRTLAQDLGARGIRVNVVCPGSISTPLTESYTSSPEFLKGLKHTVPMGRVGTSKEVSAVIRFLISQEAAYVSGAVVPVDGAWSATKSFTNTHISEFAGDPVG